MREKLALAVCTAATFLLLIIAWQAAIVIGDVPAFLVPPPADVLEAFVRGWMDGSLWPHAWFTLRGALIGFALGGTCGLLLGTAVAEIRIARLVLYPTLVAVQAMPTIAVAPLIVVYLGTGLPSKVATVALLCFFPVFVNTVAGLGSAQQGLLDLYRASGAPAWRTFVDVKLPSACDHIMAGVQTSVVLSLIGCVVSEYVASTAGLGYLLKNLATDLKGALMFAVILSFAMIGGTVGYLVQLLHKRIVFWP